MGLVLIKKRIKKKNSEFKILAVVQIRGRGKIRQRGEAVLEGVEPELGEPVEVGQNATVPYTIGTQISTSLSLLIELYNINPHKVKNPTLCKCTIQRHNSIDTKQR